MSDQVGGISLRKDDHNEIHDSGISLAKDSPREDHQQYNNVSLDKTITQTLSKKGNSIRVPITLSWENVGFSVKVATRRCPPWNQNKKKKVILQDINGLVKPGQMLAIMGSTGAGKSSLLDVLADRKSSGKVSGSIKLNGHKPDKLFKRLTGYVTQDDALPGFYTVRETLQFYADLKLPSSVSKLERKQRVNEVIEELGLEKVADSRVGTQFERGISGGEKKRLSIGSQLITDPGLLFLDEPTTGLDAFNSQGVIEVLRKLCERGRTIICTIHQPRSTIYELFDQLMILSQGRTVYFGPAREAVDYFSDLGFTCGQFINPADYFIDVTIQNERALYKSSLNEQDKLLGHENAKERGECVNLPDAFERSAICHGTKEEIKKEIHFLKENPIEYSIKVSEYASSFIRQTYILSKRTMIQTLRNPMVTYAQLGQTLFIAFLVGSIYYNIGDDQGSIQDRVGALFFMMTNQAFAMIASLNVFLQERDLFNRERASGCYRTSTYFMAKTFVEAPVLLCFPLIFGSIAYWLVGLQPIAECFGVFLAAIVSFAAVAGSMFMCIGAYSPNVVIAQIFSPLITVLFMLFGGFYVNTQNIPSYYIWLFYISFFNYGFEILCYNEFNGWGDPLQFECSDSSNVCISNGNEELQILGLGDVTNTTVRNDFIILWAMVVGYRIIGYLGLRFLWKEKR